MFNQQWYSMNCTKNDWYPTKNTPSHLYKDVKQSEMGGGYWKK